MVLLTGTLGILAAIIGLGAAIYVLSLVSELLRNPAVTAILLIVAIAILGMQAKSVFASVKGFLKKR